MFQPIGVAFLAAVAVMWVVGVVRLIRHVVWGKPRPVSPMPVQSGPPAMESVPLTPAECDAFAGLVRQFSRRR
ncbi:hypothetical protein [Streptomyces sp. NPDC046821]|uniref:hypothetical protein n=1 Tax=Streptomyces sp. NPDC046821 TaxID=3154702 RepID=UPI0033C71DE1